MSGGTFNYLEHQIGDLRDMIAHEADRYFDRSDEFDEIGQQTREEIGRRVTDALFVLKIAADMAHHIDYLFSGDIGAETFLERWPDNDVKTLCEVLTEAMRDDE